MNIDDLICVGATDNFMLSSTINRNKALVTGDVIAALINGTEEILKCLKEHGVCKSFITRTISTIMCYYYCYYLLFIIDHLLHYP